MDITVIELSSDHSREYLALRQLSETDLPQYVGPSVERELIAGSDAIASILSAYPSEGTLILGAFTDNKLVGVISVSRKLSPKFKHRAFIWGMYIVEEYRKVSVGELLLRRAKEWAQKHSEVNTLWLQVTTSNQPAVSFYTKHGFTTYGTETKALYALGEYHDIHYMQMTA